MTAHEARKLGLPVVGPVRTRILLLVCRGHRHGVTPTLRELALLCDTDYSTVEAILDDFLREGWVETQDIASSYCQVLVSPKCRFIPEDQL